MAYRSGMFNSVGGDRKYQALHFAEYFATFIGNGVFPNPSNGLQVYAKENMTVTVKPGKAWINGYYFVNDSDCDLKIENADGVLKRKDRIVLRFDTSTRLITPEIRKGVFSVSPAVPAIQRDADAYELALATVSIEKGTVALTQSAITDERLNTTVCGIVHGVVDQVDTATLFSQYQTWYAEKMEQYNTLMTHAETSFNNQLQAQQTAFDNQSATNQSAFDTQLSDNQSAFDNQTIVNQQTFDDWLASLRTVLDGDVAGNLLNLINNLDVKIDETNQTVATNKSEVDTLKIDFETLQSRNWQTIFETTITEEISYVALNDLSEYKKIKITTRASHPSSSNGSVRITLNGINENIFLTTGNSINNAFQIPSSLGKSKVFAHAEVILHNPKKYYPTLEGFSIAADSLQSVQGVCKRVLVINNLTINATNSAFPFEVGSYIKVEVIS